MSSGILNVFNKSLSCKVQKKHFYSRNKSQTSNNNKYLCCSEKLREKYGGYIRYLEYCVHHHCQWPIPRELWDFKNVKAPFIHMLQLLKKRNTDTIKSLFFFTLIITWAHTANNSSVIVNTISVNVSFLAAFLQCVWVPFVRRHTLASSSSVSVLTPKRGILEFVRLDECCSFFTPLIWDMGLFFFSFSFCVWGDGISTSCCLSGEMQWNTTWGWCSLYLQTWQWVYVVDVYLYMKNIFFL